MRAKKANVNSSKLKIMTLGDESRQLQLGESGANIIITAAATADRTLTLPALNAVGSKGCYFRIIWGVASDAAATIITTANSSELIKGTAIYYLSGGTDNSQDIVNAQLNGSSHRQLTVNENIEPGSMIELVSDGSHWYISACRLAVTNDPVAA